MLALTICFVGLIVISSKARSQDMFKDVPSGTWPYVALGELQSARILVGYPDQYFAGKSVLSRYEFAVAVKRGIDALVGHETGNI